MANDVDTNEDRACVFQSVTRTLRDGSNGLKKLDLAKDEDKLSPFDDNSLVIFNALHLDVVQDQHALYLQRDFQKLWHIIFLIPTSAK